MNGLPVVYRSVVKKIEYSKTGVRVQTATHSFRADAVLVTVPLGVLKKGDIRFSPALPQRKRSAVSRLGFGLLNKVDPYSESPASNRPLELRVNGGPEIISLK